MKKITLSILLLLGMFAFGQTATVSITDLKVLNQPATTVNFGTNVTSVNVSITASISSSYNISQGAIGVYYKRNSSTSTTPIIPTNGYSGNFVLSNGYTGTKTFTVTLSRSEFDNTGGVVYVEYQPSVSSLLKYKSSNITVTKLSDPISNNIISGDRTINVGTSIGTISGSTPIGGNGIFTYSWQQKIENGSWTVISGANSSVFLPPNAFTVTTSYRRIVTSGTITNTSNEVIITVLNIPPINNNIVTLNGNTISGTLPTGGTGTYSYFWVMRIYGDWYDISGEIGQNLELPSWIHDDYYEELNIKSELDITRIVNSSVVTKVGNWLKIPPLNSNKIVSSGANIEESMTVYPNPTSESINFSTNFSTDKEIEIVLYSEKLGSEKSVFKGKVTPNQVVNWNIPASYQKGIYFYKILSGNKEVKTGKIIVQ